MLAERRENVAVEEVAVLCPVVGRMSVRRCIHLRASVASVMRPSAGIHRYASQLVSLDRIRIRVCVLPSPERAGYHSPADSSPDVVDGFGVPQFERERLSCFAAIGEPSSTPSGNDRSILFQPGSSDSPYPRTR